MQLWGIYERVFAYRIQPVFADLHLMSLPDLKTEAGRGAENCTDADELYLYSDGRLLAQSERVHDRGDGARTEGDLCRWLLCVFLYAVCVFVIAGVSNSPLNEPLYVKL